MLFTAVNHQFYGVIKYTAHKFFEFHGIRKSLINIFLENSDTEQELFLSVHSTVRGKPAHYGHIFRFEDDTVDKGQ